MSDTQGSVRQRKAKASAAAPFPEGERIIEEVDTSEPDSPAPKPRPTTEARVEEEDSYSPWADILRVLSFLILASCALSYLISSGESYTWGLRHPPKYMQLEWWKSQLRGPIYLTPAELAQYDGRDETKPIYLAINGTIYDVSSNAPIYGPGGSYQFFAGADASRSFVTGCFAEDRTPDMRGVEDMFLPLDDPEVDQHFTAAELAELREKELAEAQQRVHDALLHWVNFFQNSPKYPKVGYVKREKDWLDKEPRKRLCDVAAKGRRPRKIPESK
ncbi:hypothetical protein F4779DRAFT_564627 [Xylariaceae sp. FL0662B]|nr:hypothetical protein F4779DRAFT_564627 [Xylariaceae sp. FL0662B]